LSRLFPPKNSAYTIAVPITIILIDTLNILS
jgi:hypothetical protein